MEVRSHFKATQHGIVPPPPPFCYYPPSTSSPQQQHAAAVTRHQTWILPMFPYDFPWPLLLYSSNSRRHHVRISQPSFMPHILLQLIPGHNQPPQCTRQYFPHSSVTASPGGNPLGPPRPLFPPQVVPERRALRRCTWSPEHPPVLVPRAVDGFLARLWHVSQVVVISPAH